MSIDTFIRTTTAGELMSRDICAAPIGISVDDALTLMVKKGVGSVVAIGDEQLGLRLENVRGLLPVYFALKATKDGQGAEPIEHFVVRDTITVAQSASVADALARMTDNRTWRLIVAEQGSVVGVLSATDVLHWIRGLV